MKLYDILKGAYSNYQVHSQILSASPCIISIPLPLIASFSLFLSPPLSLPLFTSFPADEPGGWRAGQVWRRAAGGAGGALHRARDRRTRRTRQAHRGAPHLPQSHHLTRTHAHIAQCSTGTLHTALSYCTFCQGTWHHSHMFKMHKTSDEHSLFTKTPDSAINETNVNLSTFQLYIMHYSVDLLTSELCEKYI